LAEWYWHYFQNNRWRFMQRTATAQAPGKDFTTWDLPRLFAEIDQQFGKALAAADALKKVPVSAFDDVLQKGTLPDAYRPTLYDFVANEALKFYTSAEQAAAKAEDASLRFRRTAPLSAASRNFIRGNRTPPTPLRPNSRPSDSPGLVAFHQRDTDVSAFIDTDLARLAWAYNVAFGENKVARYKAALQAFTGKWADHELSAMALQQWARVVQGEGDFVEARRLAQRGANAHRDSVGGRMCRNLISEIEAKSAAITTERVWNKSLPKIVLRYRNVTNVFFRVVAWDWNASWRKAFTSGATNNERTAFGERHLEWSAVARDSGRSASSLPAPDTLKPGFISSSPVTTETSEPTTG
jgi:hypothetical protein